MKIRWQQQIDFTIPGLGAFNDVEDVTDGSDTCVVALESLRSAEAEGESGFPPFLLLTRKRVKHISKGTCRHESRDQEEALILVDDKLKVIQSLLIELITESNILISKLGSGSVEGEEDCL